MGRLIFYDTETTGTNAAFDQILQFAAIRTNDDLVEGVRFNFRSRLLPYIVPSPQALRVTGLTIDDLLNPAHPTHYEMVREIYERALCGWGPSVHIAYNGMRFDEEFLRQALYQTCHSPFHTNTEQNTRADALALVQTAALLHPGVIAVPTNEKGKPTFKLDRLAPANGFDHSNAHDALADVEATIFVCRLVKERCPDVWARFLRFARKGNAARLVSDADAFVLVEPSRHLVNVVAALGESPGQQNMVYCWNLRIDPRPFAEMDDEELAKALAKSGSPVRRLKLNAAPSLCPLDEAPARILEPDGAELLARRGRWVVRDRAFVARILAATVAGEPQYPPSPHIERQIYDGFWSRADAMRLRVFHSADWQERVQIAEELEDARLARLARRLIWIERPDLCCEIHARAFACERAARLLADDDTCAGWNTLGKADADVARLLGELPPDQHAPYQRLADFLVRRRAECESVLGRPASLPNWL